MKKDWKSLLVNLALPLAVGGLSALVSGGMDGFSQINQPPLSPPGWLFPIVWTILYLAMGYAAYRAQNSGAEPQQISKALRWYYIQLGLNFLWSPVFFALGWYWAAFGILVALWVAIAITMKKFSELDEFSGNLLLPYLLWVTFAGYLNAAVATLN